MNTDWLKAFVITLGALIALISTVTFMIKRYQIDKRGYRVGCEGFVLALIALLGFAGVCLAIIVLYLLG